MKRILSLLVCSLLSFAAWSQATVKGVILEPSGETAIGATVREQGHPENAAATNIDGEFTVKVTNTNATLEITYIGCKTETVKLAGRTTINVTLKSNIKELDEVVVVGYGTQKKLNATGAVKTIDSEILDSRPLTDAVQGLQGAVAGLNITNDAGGAPGTAMNINIRGVGSIGEGSSSSPLVLIDGMEGDLSSINPNDIENISVLKDAASASIYGSRAPFGVVLITTKNGAKDGGCRVSYTGNVRMQNPVNVPNKVDARTFALMVNDAYQNVGSGKQFSSSWFDKLDKYHQFQATHDPSLADYQYGCEPNPWKAGEWSENFQCYADTDWYKEYLKKVAVSHEHNVTVSGGKDKVTYYFSANNLNQNGIFKHDKERYTRLALTGKVGVTFNKYVKFQWTSRLINTENEKPSGLSSIFFHQLAKLYPMEPVYAPTGEPHASSMIQAMHDGGQIHDRTRQVYNQANLTITPLKDWNIHAEINSRLENNPYTRQFNPISYIGSDGESHWLEVQKGWSDTHKVSGSNLTVNPARGETWFEKRSRQVNYFSTNIYTDYAFTVAQDHNFKVLAGMQTEYFHNDNTSVGSANILLKDTPFLPSAAASAGDYIGESKGEWSSMGVFARLNYDYKYRYLMEVNVRGDGASRFPSDQRWGCFPSFSLGWNVAEEPFWEKIGAKKVLNYLKLRTSYGVLGNQNTTSFYPYYQKMQATSGSVVLGGEQAMVLPAYSPYSTSLTWEKIQNVGAGVDFGLFDSRLQGNFDWYQRTTKDMVGPAKALLAVYGADAPKTNNAELRTRGWELELSWHDRIGKDFKYSISASLSDNRTTVTKYDSPDGNIYGWYKGKTYGEIWGYQFHGIAKSDQEMQDYLALHTQSGIHDQGIGTTWGGGDVMYEDRNKDGKVDYGSRTLDNHGDLKVVGNTTPRYAYSFTLECSWKFLDFRAYFQGIGKRDYFIGNGNYFGDSTFFGFGGDPWQITLFDEHLDYFRFAGNELGANMDDPYYGRLRTDKNNIMCCDHYIQNASYLRLKNLTIGAQLPMGTKLSKYVKKARLYFSAENLFTITKLKIFDPEALQVNDGVYAAGAGKCYPQYRTFSFGLELTF